MATSNTKITKDQKQGHIARLKTLRGSVHSAKFFHDEYNMLTYLKVVVNPYDTVKYVSTAVCSRKEKKFRGKVGEYYALMYYEMGFAVAVPRYMTRIEIE